MRANKNVKSDMEIVNTPGKIVIKKMIVIVHLLRQQANNFFVDVDNFADSLAKAFPNKLQPENDNTKSTDIGNNIF